MSGDEQKCVEKAPPVCLGEVLAHGVREHRRRGHQLDRELAGIQVSVMVIVLTACYPRVTCEFSGSTA
jgi:hypothetical protein